MYQPGVRESCLFQQFTAPSKSTRNWVRSRIWISKQVVLPYKDMTSTPMETKYRAKLPQLSLNGATAWRSGIRCEFRFVIYCTVFQVVMMELQKAIKGVQRDKDSIVNIFIDSKSSLRCCPARKHKPSAHLVKTDISVMIAKAKKVQLFWVRAHGGTAGNGRADELATDTALMKKKMKQL
ncbi:hypothetical protein EVAR_42945_1 [Eumeta japonica]|uniref:RNase H type-1 domain-containing protein n=1 Tax=Eumeta variegata TaxID=151549 RepID=A0A4C1YEM0_EUMVA|nr:hypothetical protein EVAR_42945_1 [Eumeta japonica]